MIEGFYKLQKDVELLLLRNELSTAQGNKTTLGTLTATANIKAVVAIDLANQKTEQRRIFF